MNNVTPLLAKVGLNTLALVALFSLFGQITVSAFVIVVAVLVPLGYVFGDIGVFKATDNIAATLFDFGLGIIVLWLAQASTPAIQLNITGVIFGAGVLAVTEYFFHVFLARTRLRQET